MCIDFPFCLTNLGPKKNVYFHSLNKMNIDVKNIKKKHIYAEYECSEAKRNNSIASKIQHKVRFSYMLAAHHRYRDQ